ncbi:MAG: cupin domain-containing protein [Candidatus Eremiobacteraeota bacterium]|nr:cupin domain-containing protein [Candidatus Eremiobacteraeota bacterium]
MAFQAKNYSIRSDNKFGYSTVFDIAREVEANTEPWFNQTLTQVNESVVRLGILQGEFHWHKHDLEDELFFVLEGELFIDVENAATVTLKRHQGYTMPKGVVHRTRAPQRAVVLMVEPAGVVPTGD